MQQLYSTEFGVTGISITIQQHQVNISPALTLICSPLPVKNQATGHVLISDENTAGYHSLWYC